MSTSSTASKSRSPETFKPLLKKLIQRPNDFTADDCAECVQHLCIKAADDAQAGAFLTALTLSGLDGRAGIVAACARVMREHSTRIKNLEAGTKGEHEEGGWDYRESDREGDGYTGLVDIVGTGGDGWDTYNVSTTAAIVVAGAGVRVAKHGSRAVTSSSGSSDLLMALDCRLAVPVASLSTFLPQSPFLFLFAPHYHPSFAHIAPIRRSLDFRTIFNILGPLLHPAQPERMLLGVARKELGDTYAEVLRTLGVGRALVVCGKESLDEISPEGETWTWWIENGQITTGSVHPTKDFGLPTHPLSSVRSATPALNAQTLISILDPKSNPPVHLSSPESPESPSFESIVDYVLLNAAALLYVAGRARDYKEGVAIARDSIASGAAKLAFEGFRTHSQKAVGENVAVEDDGGIAARNGFVKSWLSAKKNGELVAASPGGERSRSRGDRNDEKDD